MSDFSRRQFVRQGALGLAALGAGGIGGLILRADAQPTPSSGNLGAYGNFLKENDPGVPPASEYLRACHPIPWST